MTAAIVGGEPEEWEEASRILKGGEAADEEEEQDRDGQEGPIGLLFGGFDGLLEAGVPLDAEEDGDDGEDEEDRVGERVQGEAIEEGGGAGSSIVTICHFFLWGEMMISLDLGFPFILLSYVRLISDFRKGSCEAACTELFIKLLLSEHYFF